MDSNFSPVIYSLSLENAKQLALTGSYPSYHGLETEPLTIKELESLIEAMTAKLPIGQRAFFYYRNEQAQPKVVIVCKVGSGMEASSFSPSDPKLLEVLNVTRH